MQNDTPAQKLPTPPNNQALCLSPADVRKTLSRVNPRNPDNIPGHVLRDCAAQLTDVLTDIFNTSLSQAVVSTCLKSTSIIPVPCLNDYRLQFAYSPNRSMDDAISSTLHLALTHLENKDSYTSVSPCWPQHLKHYHTEHRCPTGLCRLCPLLFTLLTHDCTAKFSSNNIVKFADDTTVVGLISNNDETPYREEVAQLVN
ncbi:Protein adenylyltransferase SelO [Labeo rohita]|uniref:Protein adenylyltransferase SelO n=1 Tax=Labeo rohita TaxID=84645 RepID=A0ABQ8LAR8_LABRO|nr:Protein adenylyltransferase SelO [Labeo rohita]